VKVTSQMVKELRQKTNAGMMDCKRALEETEGDMEKSVDLLRQKGLAVAAKRADRATSEGTVETYIHAGGKLGVMVEVGCETDFVAKTDDFLAFAKDVAMHIAAACPLSVTRDEVPQDLIERERDIYVNQAEEANRESDKPKSADIIDKMITGKVNKFIAENCLMEQKFIKNDKLTVQDLLNELIAKMGENISVKRFARYQLGA
jgi:elongation factor Ts